MKINEQSTKEKIDIKKNILNQPKVKVNVPQEVVNLLSAIVELETNPERKKRAKELKGIITGKYPNAQALYNSLAGIRKKIKSITEAKLTKKQKILAGLMASLITATSLIMPAVKAAAANPVEEKPETKKIETPISDVEARVLAIGVKQSVWEDVENTLKDYLKKLAEAEYQGKEAHKQLLNIFKKYNVRFAGMFPSQAGKFIPETGRVQLNWNTLMRLAKGEIDLEKVFGTIRHEMTHRAQFEMLRDLLSEDEYRKFLQTEMARSYISRVIEIGAHHDEFKRRAEKMTNEQFADFLSKQSQNIIKKMVFLYPDTDPVVREIYQAMPSLKNLMVKLSKDEDMKKMKLAKEMVSEYQVLQDMLEKPSKYFGEESDMEWRKKVVNYLHKTN